jgi:hypothetical protein
LFVGWLIMPLAFDSFEFGNGGKSGRDWEREIGRPVCAGLAYLVMFGWTDSYGLGRLARLKQSRAKRQIAFLHDRKGILLCLLLLWMQSLRVNATSWVLLLGLLQTWIQAPNKISVKTSGYQANRLVGLRHIHWREHVPASLRL